MGTVEILIVFSALMALIALVTIGIDWIGKPLKNRRFIPRIYRFDDEKLPIDEYGNTTLDAAESESEQVAPPFFAPMPMQPPPMQHPAAAAMPAPIPTAAPLAAAAHAAAAAPPLVPLSSGVGSPLEPAAERSQPAPRQVAQLAPEVAAKRSAFSDTIAEDSAQHKAVMSEPISGDDKLWAASSPFTKRSAIDVGETAPKSWKPGLPLDTTINDNKPNLSVKAERFWKTIGATITESHFDADDLSRMNSGKAPRRQDPRTGREETMVLTGLREASVVDEVRMRWPDESVDPWSAQ